MAITATGRLDIYFLNVGQADTTVVLTPEGRVIVIDAARPAKLCQLLKDLGLKKGDEIDLLVITHPHNDHYRGAVRLSNEFRVKHTILSSFWNPGGFGPPLYRKFVDTLLLKRVPCQFLSGYSRLFPDSVITHSKAKRKFSDDCYVELLGPTNSLIHRLAIQGIYNTNHLSIMCRVCWEDFSVIVAADAQMENWSVFDDELRLNWGCTVLRAAHHGSGNGTQWERIRRLEPKIVVVSSDLNVGNSLPDVTGAAVFARYHAQGMQPLVALTGDVGTIRTTKSSSTPFIVSCFGDSSSGSVNLAASTLLNATTNRTDWKTILKNKAAAL